MIRVHVRQEEQADVGTLSHLPEVHGNWGVRNDFAIHSYRPGGEIIKVIGVKQLQDMSLTLI